MEACENASARQLQASVTPCHQASRQSSDVSQLTKSKVYPEWFTLPLAPYARRRTLQKEIVPGQAWLGWAVGALHLPIPTRWPVAGEMVLHRSGSWTKFSALFTSTCPSERRSWRCTDQPSSKAKKLQESSFYYLPHAFVCCLASMLPQVWCDCKGRKL